MSTPRKSGGKSLKRRVTKAATPAVPQQTTKETAADAAPHPRKKHYVQPQVLEFIRKADGQPVTCKQMAEEIGCPEGSVKNAVLQLMKSVPQIEVVTKGQVWKWDVKTTDLRRPEDRPEYGKQDPITGDFGPVPEPPRPVDSSGTGEVWYLEVGVDAANNPIVKQEGDPTLYRVVPL